jgi:hypothetical protein
MILKPMIPQQIIVEHLQKSSKVKVEMRYVRNNRTQVLIVLVYKDTLLMANNLTSILSVIAHVLQDYNDVFLEKTPAEVPPL